MARFPCDFGDHRYKGPQRTLYPAIVDGVFENRRRVRSCEDHFRPALDLARSAAEAAELLGGSHCSFDSCESESTYAVFVTAYDRGQEREDLYFRACAAHAEHWAGPALGFAQDALRGLPEPF